MTSHSRVDVCVSVSLCVCVCAQSVAVVEFISRAYVLWPKGQWIANRCLFAFCLSRPYSFARSEWANEWMSECLRVMPWVCASVRVCDCVCQELSYARISCHIWNIIYYVIKYYRISHNGTNGHIVRFTRFIGRLNRPFCWRLNYSYCCCWCCCCCLLLFLLLLLLLLWHVFGLLLSVMARLLARCACLPFITTVNRQQLGNRCEQRYQIEQHTPTHTHVQKCQSLSVAAIYRSLNIYGDSCPILTRSTISSHYSPACLFSVLQHGDCYKMSSGTAHAAGLSILSTHLPVQGTWHGSRLQSFSGFPLRSSMWICAQER